MIALLRKETGHEIVRVLIEDIDQTCYAHALNLCEVFYDFARAEGETDAEQAVADLLSIGIIERDDLDALFWRQVARLKAVHRRVSLADCCAIALTLRVGGELVTSDHHELDPLAAAGVCPILFFR
jgi:predicted nucleic acid-binding protein